MARTKKQKEENDKEYESYAKIAYWIIFIVAIFIFNRCSNSNNNDNIKTSTKPSIEFRDPSTYHVEVLNHYDCGSLTFHSVCGIVKNHEAKTVDVVINVFYYDADGVKVDERTATTSIDPNGKSKFKTIGASSNLIFDNYKISAKAWR